MAPRALEGQVSLVTGAGRGIGRATAVALADAGSAVVLGARTVSQVEDAATEIRDAGGRAVAIHLDVTDLASVRQFVAAGMDTFGQVDVLVNNAGSNNGGDDGAVGPLWEINPEAWWTDVEVNLRGTFLCSHAALPDMVCRGHGYIVNVTSMVAGFVWPYDSAYASSKAGQVRLTDSLAAEVRDHGISVFALSPVACAPSSSTARSRTEAGQKWLAPGVGALVFPDVPPELAAGEIVFLCSGEADGLSGRLLHTGWDLRDLARRAAEIVERDALQIRLIPAD